MSWTTPRTWVTGEVVTASELNTHVRDNFNAISTLQRYVGNSLVTQSGSVTETDLFPAAGTYQLPGGVLGTSGAVRVRVMLDLANSIGSTVTFTFKAYYGSSSVTLVVLSVGTGAPTHHTGFAEFDLVANGATNAQMLGGTVNIPDTGLGGGSGASGPTALAIDSTAAQNLRLTVTHSNAGGTQVTKSYVAEIRAIP